MRGVALVRSENPPSLTLQAQYHSNSPHTCEGRVHVTSPYLSDLAASALLGN